MKTSDLIGFIFIAAGTFALTHFVKENNEAAAFGALGVIAIGGVIALAFRGEPSVITEKDSESDEDDENIEDIIEEPELGEEEEERNSD